jgi:hypothetical protein
LVNQSELHSETSQCECEEQRTAGLDNANRHVDLLPVVGTNRTSYHNGALKEDKLNWAWVLRGYHVQLELQLELKLKLKQKNLKKLLLLLLLKRKRKRKEKRC